MFLSMPFSEAASLMYSRIEGPPAIATEDVHGLNRKPSVNMSESERMPGYLNRSQGPPMCSRRSRIAYDFEGHLSCRCQAALIPEMPAPMISTSRCSVMAPGYQHCVE